MNPGSGSQAVQRPPYSHNLYDYTRRDRLIRRESQELMLDSSTPVRVSRVSRVPRLRCVDEKMSDQRLIESPDSSRSQGNCRKSRNERVRSARRAVTSICTAKHSLKTKLTPRSLIELTLSSR